ncbi:transcription factor bHLH95 [Cicer arietinum]|uniref:Transcription factor bHLH95 n=1 Tax=Cicer arietinum TaxID=3827 RepID=A0A1S2YIW1_CICAR|nr:transcription factor bHLH95 [Cicer arietinum]
MAMSVDHDEGVHLGLVWENEAVDLTNSDTSGESSKQKLEMKAMREKEGIKKRSDGEGKDGKYRDSDHEIHIWTERERRKKMRNMFSGLHALLPQLPSKADKSTIVDAAVKHIKNLQQTLEKLEKEKEKRLKSVSSFGSESSIINSHWHPYESREAIIADQGSSNYNFPSNAIVTSNPSNAFSTPPPQVAFQTWSSQNVVLNICGGEAQFCICATKKPGLMTTIAFVLEKHRIDVISANIVCNGNGNFYMILAHAKQASHQLQDANSMEETYKQAAGEIMILIS